MLTTHAPAMAMPTPPVILHYRHLLQLHSAVRQPMHVSEVRCLCLLQTCIPLLSWPTPIHLHDIPGRRINGSCSGPYTDRYGREPPRSIRRQQKPVEKDRRSTIYWQKKNCKPISATTTYVHVTSPHTFIFDSIYFYSSATTTCVHGSI